MRVLLPCLLAAVSAIRTGPNDNDCTANSGEFGIILDEDGFATCIHKYVVEPHSECPPTFKGCFNGTQLGSVDQYNELEFANEFQFGNGTFTQEPTWGTNFSVLHCADWCRENADNGCIGFLTDDLDNSESYEYGVNYDYTGISRPTCYLVTEPGCTEDLDENGDFFGYAFHDMNDCNIPDKTDLIDGECTGSNEWSEWIDSSPQSKIDRTGSERELISDFTGANFNADTNLRVCDKAFLVAAQAREKYIPAANLTIGANFTGEFFRGEFGVRSERSATFEVLTFSKAVGLICNQADQFAGESCSNYEMRICCSDYSRWQQWGAWSECSDTCGGGTQVRTRACDNTFPDKPCIGSSEQSAGCNHNLCPRVSECSCVVPDSGSPWMFNCDSVCVNGEKCYPGSFGAPGETIDGFCQYNFRSWESCQSHLDPYIWTFDSPKRSGDRLKVFGIGEYVLSQYLGSGDPNDIGFYKITITTAPWNGFDTVSQINGGTVIVYKPNNVDFYTISFDMNRAAKSKVTLTTGGVPADIPDSEIINGDHIGYIRFRGWPSPYYIDAWNGLSLNLKRSMSRTWTPTGFTLRQATIYKGQSEGLCGNMNYDFSDDFTLKNGNVLTLATRSTHYDFAKDWEESCTANCRKRRDDSVDPWEVNCDGTATDPVCDNLFVNSYYDECREVLNPDDSIAICKLEYCLVPEPATINRIVENYIDNCRQILPTAESVCKVGSEEFYETLLLEPDDDALYLQCGDNQEYSSCIKPSRDLRTCLDFRSGAPVLANEDTQAGCKCVSGFYLQGDVCFPEANCPSYENQPFVGFDTDGDGVGDGVLPGTLCNVESALNSLIAVRDHIDENAERGFYKRKKTFLRALDNAFYNKKKSKNGEKVPFGCAMSTEMAVPEEVLNDCSFKTTTDITSTVQKTCDDLSAFLDFTFSDCKAGKDKKGSKAARKSVRKLGKKCKKFIRKL